MIIGITGKSGSGKNHVAKYMEEMAGYVHYDLDKLGHEALEANVGNIRVVFGDGVIRDGSVDRKSLGEIVFKDKEKLKQLEFITHAWITTKVVTEMKNNQDNKVILNGAILHKAPALLEKVDCVFFVKAPFFTRLKRLMDRDGKPYNRLLHRMWMQRDIKISKYRQKMVQIVRNCPYADVFKEIDLALWCLK